METLISQSLSALERAGMRKKSVQNLKSCGIGPIAQYFAMQGKEVYSKAEVDNFVLQIRAEYEAKTISPFKWGTIRRAAVILEDVYTTGEASLKQLTKWEALHNPLHQEPSLEQLHDKTSLLGLFARTKHELEKFDFSPKTLSNYTYDGFDVILRYCSQHGITKYDIVAINHVITDARTKYEGHQMCRSSYQNVRKVAAFLDECYETDQLKWHHLPKWGLRYPNAYFSKVLDDFCKETNHTEALTKSSIATVSSAIRRFLFELEDMGHQDFSGVVHRVVSDCILLLAKRRAGGLDSTLFSIRTFLHFLKETSITSIDLSVAIPKLVAQRRTIREGFHVDEIDKLLNCIDRSTSIGKRDYALMVTAMQTGLRAVDIANLKRADINWRSNEIRISQQKTGVPLCLPLKPEVGNAIATYMLYGRQDCNSPYIFLCKDKPNRPFNSRSASSVISRYMRRAGIADSAMPRRGFHSFRRTFAIQLLDSELSLDLLRELMGHSKIDSLKPYLAINETGLKSCALGLALPQKAGEQP